MCQCLFVFLMIFNNDPIQHICFYFVLNCVTIKLDLLLRWYGHCSNSMCKNGKWIDMQQKKTNLEGQLQTADTWNWRMFNVWNHVTVAVFCVELCFFKSQWQIRIYQICFRNELLGRIMAAVLLLTCAQRRYM